MNCYNGTMPDIILIAHNIRSTHNVGSLLRTADGFGVKSIIFSGYTPYPAFPGDTRLPHIKESLTKKIHKAALGAETMVPFSYQTEPDLQSLSARGYHIIGLEQDNRAIDIRNFKSSEKIVLIIGEEVHGLTHEIKQQCQTLLEIPMYGQKESFNVSIASGIALYQLCL